MTPEFIFTECLKLMGKKDQDYTTDAKVNSLENFDRASIISSWFVSDSDKVYTTLIAIKLARLGSLLERDKMANNESIEDTFKDLINYCTLWASSRI